MNLKEAYSYSVAFLNGNKVDEADFKALCIVCHIAGIKNSDYASHINDDIINYRVLTSIITSTEINLGTRNPNSEENNFITK